MEVKSRAEARGKSAREGVFYIDRRSGELCEERVFGRAFMELFYGTAPGGLLLDLVLTRRIFSVLYGRYNDSALSRRKIGPFAAELSIPLDEVAGRMEDFRSFNDFFARRLKPEARPLDPDPEALLSPADARVYVHPMISGASLLPVKGAAVPVAALLDDAGLAESFANGAAVVFRLCPSDYHRFHFPAAGVPGAPRSIPGIYHSVSPFALEKGLDVFCRNHRVVTILESERFGRIALIAVGALCVGAIVSTYEPGRAIPRGAEQGFFKFGGSTIVMLTEPGRVAYDADLARNTEEGLETLVQFGMRIGRSVR